MSLITLLLTWRLGRFQQCGVVSDVKLSDDIESNFLALCRIKVWKEKLLFFCLKAFKKFFFCCWMLLLLRASKIEAHKNQRCIKRENHWINVSSKNLSHSIIQTFDEIICGNVFNFMRAGLFQLLYWNAFECYVQTIREHLTARTICCAANAGNQQWNCSYRAMREQIQTTSSAHQTTQ